MKSKMFDDKVDIKKEMLSDYRESERKLTGFYEKNGNGSVQERWHCNRGIRRC